jgi:hypothetical protein
MYATSNQYSSRWCTFDDHLLFRYDETHVTNVCSLKELVIDNVEGIKTPRYLIYDIIYYDVIVFDDETMIFIVYV